MVTVIPFFPIDVVAKMEVFDEYVNEHYQKPLYEARSTLLALQISTNANTIGILILGFIMNFEDVSKIWKPVFALLAMFSMLSGSIMTVILLFGF